MSVRRDAVTVRPALLDDRTATAELVRTATTENPYAELPVYFVRRAFDAFDAAHVADAECRVVLAELDDRIIGCAVYGNVAGTVGTGRIHFVGVSNENRRVGIGSILCNAAVAELTSGGARTVVVELPDDSALASGLALLEACGFVGVARVADYYRDAIDLVILERRAT